MVSPPQTPWRDSCCSSDGEPTGANSAAMVKSFREDLNTTVHDLSCQCESFQYGFLPFLGGRLSEIRYVPIILPEGEVN